MNKNDSVELSENLTDIIDKLREFLLPPLYAAAGNDTFLHSWPSGGPWTPKK